MALLEDLGDLRREGECSRDDRKTQMTGETRAHFAHLVAQSAVSATILRAQIKTRSPSGVSP